jgi:membrane protein DedA with SNARE-associated domain
MLDYVINTILNLQGWGLYLFLALVLISGAFGLPVPEDLPLLYAGKLISDGQAELLWIGLSCYLAILVGDLIIFGAGYWGGQQLLKSERFRSHWNGERVSRIEANLKRHSLLVIFLARHLFYFRSVTFLSCGAIRMSPLRFLVTDALAALISVPLMLTLGYLSADYISSAIGQLAKVKELLLILGGSALALYFASCIYRRLRAK